MVKDKKGIMKDRDWPEYMKTAFKVFRELEIKDQSDKAVIIGVCRRYEGKIPQVIARAKEFPWWQKNKKAAFLKALGFINHPEREKEETIKARPTIRDSELEAKIIRVCKWLKDNKEHKKYQKGINWVADKLYKNSLFDWFINQDVDFEVSMEIYNFNDPDNLYEYAKKLF